MGIEPSYLSKIEAEERQASEDILESLAGVLEANPHLFLAMAGKVTQEFRQALQERPEAFAALLESSLNWSTKTILKTARAVRDGDW
jgi:transcriptional regulator with XRE-family HTH domain